MASVLMTGALVLYANGAQLGTSMREMMTRALTIDRAALDDPAFMTEALGRSMLAALDACTPLFVALVAAAFLGHHRHRRLDLHAGPAGLQVRAPRPGRRASAACSA